MKQQISGNGILTPTFSFNFHAVGNEIGLVPNARGGYLVNDCKIIETKRNLAYVIKDFSICIYKK